MFPTVAGRRAEDNKTISAGFYWHFVEFWGKISNLTECSRFCVQE